MWWDSWWSPTQCGNVRLAQTRWVGLWGWWPASVQCGWGTMSSPAWSWLRPGLVPVPGSPGTKEQKGQEQGACTERMNWALASPMLLPSYHVCSLEGDTEHRNLGGWLTEGLNGKDLGPWPILKYQFWMWPIQRKNHLQTSMLRLFSTYKAKISPLRDVQTLSFINSVPASSPTIAVPYPETERALEFLTVHAHQCHTNLAKDADSLCCNDSLPQSWSGRECWRTQGWMRMLSGSPQPRSRVRWQRDIYCDCLQRNPHLGPDGRNMEATPLRSTNHPRAPVITFQQEKLVYLDTGNIWWTHKQWIRTNWRDLCHQAEGLICHYKK